MKEEAVRVLVTGDFCPMYRTEKLALKQDFDPVFNDYIEVFRDNDLNVIDLECPLTLASAIRPKTGPHQKAHPDTIQLLKYAGVHLAALANNHIMDYDSPGIRETLESCQKHDIHTVGVGTSREEAARPFSITIKGKKLAILNFADNEFLSTTDSSYQCNPIDPVRAFNDLGQVRQTHDYLLVILHAGNEFYELPSPRTKELYRYLVDLGADAIIAHHTHAFSGYEIYKSKPIFYGLGNFLYDAPGNWNSPWNHGYVVRLHLSEQVDFEIIPLKQSNEKPGVFHLDKEESDAFHQELKQLNRIIVDDDKLEAEYTKYCQSVYPMYDAFIEPPFGKYVAALRKRGLFPKLMSRKKRLLLLNLIRCESHRDVLLKMLKKYE